MSKTKRTIHETHRLRDGTTYEKPIVQVFCCGEWLDCRNFTNTCDCGADYNFSGARLAPRSQWGEETGESWMDCY